MRKSTIIATCLVNSRAFSSLPDAEAAVRVDFRHAFPEENCADWNGDVDPDTAASIIRQFDRSPPPNVRQFIDELRHVAPPSTARAGRR
jgi:hypothetical protein